MKEKISPQETLQKLILEKESQQFEDQVTLMAEVKVILEQLKPANLIKNTIKSALSEPELQGNLLKTTAGFTAGYIIKKIATAKSINPLVHLNGILLEILVRKVVINNGDKIKSFAASIFQKFGKKNQPYK